MRRLPVLFLCLLSGHLGAQTGTVRDQEGTAYSWKQMPDGRHWLTQNLNLTTEESWWYNNDPARASDYGRLYTFRAARKVCPQLGAGWRLPAREDWLRLAAAYGGVFQGQQGGEAAFHALLRGGASGFGAVLGGGRRSDQSFARGEAHGFYWMATEGDPGMAWFLNFGAGSARLFAQADGEQAYGMSVRCVRDRP